jgi:hypothetical protein
MPTGHVDQRLDGDPRALHLDEEVGNAFVLRHRRIRAGQHKDPLRVLRAAGPDLLAVDHEIVAVFDCRGLQGSQVGTGVGLAIPLAPDHLAAGDARQMHLLLFFSAIQHDGRAKVANSIDAYDRGSGVGHFFVEDDLFPKWPILSTQILGPRDHQPSTLRQFLGELVCESELLVIVLIVKDLLAPAWRQFGF